jgi:hypothetical protein
VPGKAACNGAIAESMVKLVKNAVFEQSLHKKNNTNNKARLRPALYVRTNATRVKKEIGISNTNNQLVLEVPIG